MTDPVLRIILVPATSQSRTYEVSYKRLRVLRGISLVLGTVAVFMIATWAYMASRVSHMVELEAEVALMRAEQERIPGLRRRLSTVERQYADIRVFLPPMLRGRPPSCGSRLRAPSAARRVVMRGATADPIAGRSSSVGS